MHKGWSIPCNDKVIHIYEEITESCAVPVNEKRGICLGDMKTQLKDARFKSCIPSLWGLFKAIKCFV
jgi:hypothetical protein